MLRVSSPIASLIEPIAPARLGRSFRWLLASAIVDNVGDGIVLSAGPLLIAALTRDPFVVSLAVLARVMPPLLFGIVAGTVADRIERRLIVIGVNVGRAVVLAILATMIATGTASIAIVLAAIFILGTAETFADIGTSSLLPGLVRREDLGTANARIQGAFILTNQLLLPPVGAFLFVIGMSVPFAVDAACVALGAVLISRVATSGLGTGEADDPRPAEEPRRSVRAEVVEGLRWLIGHPPMRTLALTIVAFNVTWGAAWGVLVLYARDRLGMDAVGFGLLTTASALGGVLGTLAYGRLTRALSLGNIMRIGLLIETVTHLVLALTTSSIVVLVTMFVFGVHAFVWGTTATTIRQRAVPDALLGRVTGVYTVGIYGGIAVGTPIGGLLAGQFGLTAPFWFAFVGSALLVGILWRQFDHIAHAGAPT